MRDIGFVRQEGRVPWQADHPVYLSNYHFSNLWLAQADACASFV
jgi:hypothetical protein